ncbi:fibronectin type III domain-containing protein [Anaerostipes sp.]|uniref:fibronectin type III domain-containing protein n=1 Tax=Anaerostipes sp. TaxID=1872530 RepID=UPI0025C1D693|nr:fibronectin type III domain-containing protein [Anaerostipes sp.]MBS7007800.1 fibronectin type III domain-containing protein [Anaerostipes sp.]
MHIFTDGSGYQIKYASNKKAEYQSVKKNYITLKRLKAGKKYYFKVRAYKIDSAGKRVYSKYSRQMVRRVL